MVGIVAGCKEQDNYTHWLNHHQLAYTIIHDETEAADIAVMIFCGGPDLGKAPDRDALDRRIYDYCAAHQIPMLGICRGMQEIAHFMGASLIEDLGELNAIHKAQPNRESRHHTIQLSDGRQTLVNSRHHQAVADIPFDCDLSGKAEDGTLELLQSSDGQLLLVQCHPEREEMRNTEIEQMCLLFINDNFANSTLQNK